MKKMWQGVTSGVTDKTADSFNSSIGFDKRLYEFDIKGSLAHARMLEAKGIISKEEAGKICQGLEEILEELKAGSLPFEEEAEDIHMFVEEVLTKRIGSAGKKLHTARSRNDQVALDLRLYLREEVREITALIKELIRSLLSLAKKHQDTIMPGYTHLQRAQPISFALHLLAYVQMFSRDLSRLDDASKRMNVSPIGSCALAGTTYDIDRRLEAELLGFDEVCQNSMDGVSDRDFCLELLSVFSILMMHLSRLCEELVLWSSWEFRFIQLADEFTTGSSIMPQKKNPDMAELIRGKTGRVYGDLMALLTMLKGLPLAYNKDMQEDKEAVFDAVDTVKACLRVASPMIQTMKPLPENMKKAAQQGFINATDLADYLVRKGLAFRDAYRLSGEIVADCMDRQKVLEELSMDEWKHFSDLFEEDIYPSIDLKNCMEKRNSEGASSAASVQKQIKQAEQLLGPSFPA